MFTTEQKHQFTPTFWINSRAVGLYMQIFYIEGLILHSIPYSTVCITCITIEYSLDKILLEQHLFGVILRFVQNTFLKIQYHVCILPEHVSDQEVYCRLPKIGTLQQITEYTCTLDTDQVTTVIDICPEGFIL